MVMEIRRLDGRNLSYQGRTEGKTEAQGFRGDSKRKDAPTRFGGAGGVANLPRIGYRTVVPIYDRQRKKT